MLTQGITKYSFDSFKTSPIPVYPSVDGNLILKISPIIKMHFKACE